MGNLLNDNRRPDARRKSERLGQSAGIFVVGIFLYCVGGLWAVDAGGLSPDNRLVSVQGVLSVVGAGLAIGAFFWYRRK